MSPTPHSLSRLFFPCHAIPLSPNFPPSSLSLPIPSCVPHPDSPAGAGGSRQVEQHCPGPRCRWCWGQSSTGQGVKEHSTSPPWEHGNGSLTLFLPSAPSKAGMPPAGGSIPGDPHPWGHPGPTWQTQVVQSSPSRLNRAPCAYVCPRKLHFSGKRGSSGLESQAQLLPNPQPSPGVLTPPDQGCWDHLDCRNSSQPEKGWGRIPGGIPERGRRHSQPVEGSVGLGKRTLIPHGRMMGGCHPLQSIPIHG